MGKLTEMVQQVLFGGAKLPEPDFEAISRDIQLSRRRRRTGPNFVITAQMRREAEVKARAVPKD